MTIVIDAGILKGALLHTVKKSSPAYNTIHILVRDNMITVEATDVLYSGMSL